MRRLHTDIRLGLLEGVIEFVPHANDGAVLDHDRIFGRLQSWSIGEMRLRTQEIGWQ